MRRACERAERSEAKRRKEGQFDLVELNILLLRSTHRPSLRPIDSLPWEPGSYTSLTALGIILLREFGLPRRGERTGRWSADGWGVWGEQFGGRMGEREEFGWLSQD